jgi:hypothetical protein
VRELFGLGGGFVAAGRPRPATAYVSIRQHTSAYVSVCKLFGLGVLDPPQHTSAYVSIRQHTSAYASSLV